MPRPKGSKNKAKPTTISTTDFTSLIAEKSSTKEALVADIAYTVNHEYHDNQLDP